VLVGHGLGGLVIKSLCFVENSQEKRCKAFKQNIKGIVFYSVPHTASEEESIEQQHIKLFAFVEGQKVQSHGYLSSFVGFSSLGQNLVS